MCALHNPSSTPLLNLLHTANSTVEEVKTLVGMTGDLEKFVPRYSAVEAGILNKLRDERVASKGRKGAMVRGARQGVGGDTSRSDLTTDSG